MRSFLVPVLSILAVVSALPLPRTRSMSDASRDARNNDNNNNIAVLGYNVEDAYTKFEAAAGKDDEALVFELQVRPTSDISSSNITLNSQLLHLTWTLPPHSTQWIAPQSTQSLSIPDRLGFPHLVHIVLAGEIAAAPGLPITHNDAAQNLNLTIESVDGVASGLGFVIVTNPTAPRRLRSISSSHKADSIDFAEWNQSFMVDHWESDETSADHFSHSNSSQDDFLDIESEIESLLLLEAEAGEIHAAIAAKKEAIAKCLKTHRDQVTLRHLLQQCDGLVCAAKIIAQRMCDKMGILTYPKVEYAKVQSPSAQKLIESDEISDEKFNVSSKMVVSEKYTNVTRSAAFASAAIQPIQVIYPHNAMTKALSVVAALFGLSAMFSIIRRKCMSMRKRVEREADLEERRNARAYRRAARRAEMRRRWQAFITAINCFKGEEEPRSQDYEEKRALILQDAFLEQDAETAEKGEVMDAEIRELRHAHDIVASLVNESRFELVTPINDPPPPLVTLPYTPVTRSRASSATLPSYHSESLPDYTSRYQRTDSGSSGSSSSSIRSNSVVLSSRANSIVIDGLIYTPNTSEDGTFTGTSTIRSFSTRSVTDCGSDGNRISRYTPTSSVIEMSPRASEETLRFSWRRSGDTIRRSWDTNDL